MKNRNLVSRLWRLGRLANAFLELGPVEQAIQYFEQAAVIIEDVKAPLAEESLSRLTELNE
jgi:hypothetical protein